MDDSITTIITNVSPVLRLMLNVCDALNVTVEQAHGMIEPYTYVADDGLRRIREDADLPRWLLDAMRAA